MGSRQAKKQLLDALLGDQTLPAGQGDKKAQRSLTKASGAAPLGRPAAQDRSKIGKAGRARGEKKALSGAQARGPCFATLCLLPMPPAPSAD